MVYTVGATCIPTYIRLSALTGCSNKQLHRFIDKVHDGFMITVVVGFSKTLGIQYTLSLPISLERCTDYFVPLKPVRSK